MPFKRQFRDKYASRSPERICCLNSVQLVLFPFCFLFLFHSSSFHSPTIFDHLLLLGHSRSMSSTSMVKSAACCRPRRSVQITLKLNAVSTSVSFQKWWPHVTTRHHTSGIVNHLGPSAELPVADLPTLQNVLKQCQLLREPHSFLKTYGSFAMAADVLPLFLDVWKRANAKLVALPIRISDDSLIRKVNGNGKFSQILPERGERCRRSRDPHLRMS